MAQSNIKQLQQTWEELGREDPLWAVVSHPHKRGGRWNLIEFMETGEEAVAHYCDLIETHVPNRSPFSHVLDFGCGVGRLTSAWGRRSKRGTGVGNFAPVLETTEKKLKKEEKIEFLLHPK